MQTLQSRPEIDHNWNPEDHGRYHPKNVRTGVILQELLDRASVQHQSATPPSPPLYRHVELVTEAGYSHHGAMRAVAERNNGRRYADETGSVHDWHHWRRNRYLGFDEVPPQARREPYIEAALTEEIGGVQREYQPAEYDDSVERYADSPIPELDSTGVFRRLGQSMLVAAAKISHTVSATLRL